MKLDNTLLIKDILKDLSHGHGNKPPNLISVLELISVY